MYYATTLPPITQMPCQLLYSTNPFTLPLEFETKVYGTGERSRELHGDDSSIMLLFRLYAYAICRRTFDLLTGNSVPAQAARHANVARTANMHFM